MNPLPNRTDMAYLLLYLSTLFMVEQQISGAITAGSLYSYVDEALAPGINALYLKQMSLDSRNCVE